MANALAVATAGEDGRMSAEAVVRDILDPSMGLFCDVAELDGAVCGYVLHHVAYETAYAARGWYLSDIFVEPRARRKGVARALIADVARQAKARGAVFLWWMSKGRDPAADALYQKIADIADPVTAFAATYQRFEKLCE